MKKISVMLFLCFLMLGVPIILAQETEIKNPGITPDSILWGIDTTLEQISLFLATSPDAKAAKGLEIASERLSEIKVMIEKNKLEAAEKAQENHGKTLVTVEESIGEIEEDDATEEIIEIIEIEKELQDHKNEVDQVFGELKIKIKVEGVVTQEQQDLIDSILANLEGQTGKVEIEIKNKKGETKIKIKIETGKSDEEIEKDIEKLEVKGGVAGIEVKAEIVGSKSEVKIERKFSTTTINRTVIIQEIIDRFALEREIADVALEIEVEDEDEKLKEKFKVEVKVKDGVAEVEIKLKFILEVVDREGILDAVVDRSKLTVKQIEDVMEFKDKDKEDDEKLEIEVEIEDDFAEIEVEFNGDEFEFTLETTNQDVIISEIIERTGLTREQIENVIEFDIEEIKDEMDEEGEEKEKDEELPSLKVSDQSLVDSQIVIDSFFLDKPGYVVIHKSVDEKPGPVIGNSELVSGSHSDFKVTIDETQAGEMIFAMLHYDDGDGSYEFPGDDLPVKLEDEVVVKQIDLE